MLEIEGIAAALVVERGCHRTFDRLAQEFSRLVTGQRAQLEPGERPLSVGPVEGGGEPLGHLARADGERHQHGRSRWPAQQRADQLHRPGVGPVEVVQHEHEGLGRSEQREQFAHGTVRAVALVLRRLPTAGDLRGQ